MYQSKTSIDFYAPLNDSKLYVQRQNKTKIRLLLKPRLIKKNDVVKGIFENVCKRKKPNRCMSLRFPHLTQFLSH